MSDEDENTAPEVPDGVPTYVADGLQRQDVDDLRSVVEYVENLIEYRQSAPDVDTVLDAEDSDEVMDATPQDNYTEVIKKVTCGSDCGGCPHGPYVYRVRYSPSGLTWDYMGPLKEYGE